MNTSVNLLPSDFRRRQSARRIISQWAMLSVLVMSTMMMIWLQQSDHNAADEIAALQASATPVRARGTRTKSLQREVDRLEEQWDVLRALLPSDDVLQTIGSVGIACKESDNQVRIDSMDLTIDRQTQLNSEKASSDGATADKHPSSLVLRVRADDDSAAAALVDRLKSDARFKTVKLHSAGGSGEGSMRAVELRCQIIASGELQ